MVDGGRVVRAHHDRRQPLPAVDPVARRQCHGLRIDGHAHPRIIAQVLPVDLAAITAAEDDIGMTGVQRDGPGFAAGGIAPFLLRAQAVVQPPLQHADARIVLLRAIEAVGELVVHLNVIQFGGGLVVERREGAPVVHRHLGAAVARQREQPRIARVDPDVVGVAMRHRYFLERGAAIVGAQQGHVHHIDLARVHRIGAHMAVIPRPPAHLLVAVDQRPGRAAIIRTIKPAAGLRLHQSPYAARVGGRHCHPHLADVAHREPAGQLAPRCAAVGGLVHPAVRPAGNHRPWLALDARQAGINLVRIVWAHGERHRAGAIVHEQHMLPRAAAVACAVDAAFLVAAKGVAESSHVDHVGVARVHDQFADGA